MQAPLPASSHFVRFSDLWMLMPGDHFPSYL